MAKRIIFNKEGRTKYTEVLNLRYCYNDEPPSFELELGDKANGDCEVIIITKAEFLKELKNA